MCYGKHIKLLFCLSLVLIMTYTLFLRVIALLGLFFIAPSVAFAQSYDVSVRYGQHLNSDRLVLDFPNRFDVSVFTLQNPDRIVIDLPKSSWNVDVSKTVEKSTVKHIRVGDFDDHKSRIVIDMGNATTIDKFFWLPASKTLKDRLVIDYKKGVVSVQRSASSIDDVIAKTIGQKTQGQVVSSVVFPPKKPTMQARASVQPSQKSIIVIDPGHGGKDSGARARSGLFEKTVVLKLAKELKQHLERTGRYEVFLTRNNDRYIALKKRVSFSRKKKADLFVSIHADSIDNRHVSGASVYTLSEKASDKQTAKLAARENKSDIIAGLDLSEEDPDVTSILLDLVTRDTTNQSKFFANLIVEELQRHRIKTLERPHRHAGFAVLKAPDVPAILVESGFMSNATEARRLNDPAHRQKLVASLADGIDSYFLRLASLNAN